MPSSSLLIHIPCLTSIDMSHRASLLQYLRTTPSRYPKRQATSALKIDGEGLDQAQKAVHHNVVSCQRPDLMFSDRKPGFPSCSLLAEEEEAQAFCHQCFFCRQS